MKKGLQKLTDKKLEAEREQADFRRSENVENAINASLVLICKAAAKMFIAFSIACFLMYTLWLYDHSKVAADTISKIETMFTHVMALASGYLIHIIKRQTRK